MNYYRLKKSRKRRDTEKGKEGGREGGREEGREGGREDLNGTGESAGRRTVGGSKSEAEEGIAYILCRRGERRGGAREGGREGRREGGREGEIS
jgi:hypothetical protein